MLPDQPEKQYVVMKGEGLGNPYSGPSWAKTHAKISGIKNGKHKSFRTVQEARDCMDAHGLKQGEYEEEIRPKSKKSTKKAGNKIEYYAVANGRSPGVYTEYSGEGGAEAQVSEYPHNCHKKFYSREEAEKFIEEWKHASGPREDVFAAAKIKDKVKRESEIKREMEPHDDECFISAMGKLQL